MNFKFKVISINVALLKQLSVLETAVPGIDLKHAFTCALFSLILLHMLHYITTHEQTQ